MAGEKRSLGGIVLPEQTAPATPASGTLGIYAKTDGLPYAKNDAGTEMALHDPDAELMHWLGL
jgi:hypothetical protein